MLLFLQIALGVIFAAGNTVNFDSATVRRTPDGWTAVSGRWEIRKDPTAPTPPNVLAELSLADPSKWPPVATLGNVSVCNGDVSVRVKILGGRAEQSAGIVFRYRDENHFYAVQADAGKHKIGLYRVDNGRWIAVAPPVSHPVAFNAWNILKVSIRGSRIQVYENHRRLLTADGGAYAVSGGIGLVTGAGAAALFDDLHVYPR